ELILEPVTIPVIFDDCETTTITNTIVAENDGLLAYPISIAYTIFPPDGSAQINITNTYNSGPEFELDATQIIDLYNDQIFDIEIIAEDACGNTATLIDEIDPNPLVTMFSTEGYCGKNLNVQVLHFLPSYSIEFTEAPDCFDPAVFNEDFPDNFSSSNSLFGLEEQAVPYGTYTV